MFESQIGRLRYCKPPQPAPEQAGVAELLTHAIAHRNLKSLPVHLCSTQ